jgi:hypothetical protein
MTETETKWSERVRDWKASGKTAREFADGRDFKASTLRYWACVLRRGSGLTARPGRREPDVRMARVVRVASKGDDAMIVTVGAARVAVRPGFDAALLRQVVQALGEER